MTPLPTRSGPLPRLEVFARDIKITHSLFALPFAFLSAVLAGRMYPHSLTIGKTGLILLCMVTARTVAMSANRLLDAKLDAQNPRTAARAIPSGKLSRAFVLLMLVLCAAAFLAACTLFYFLYKNPWPIILAVPVLGFVSAYPFLKRFTRFCHYYLGASLALAPICAWIAVTGRLDAPPIWMATAVLLWTAGFDIIYACQDFAVDRRDGLFSIPARIGVGPALLISRLTHAACLAMLILTGISAWPMLGYFYFTGVAAAAVLMIVEHTLVKADDLSRVGIAFFTVNGIMSVLLGTMGIVDLLRR